MIICYSKAVVNCHIKSWSAKEIVKPDQPTLVIFHPQNCVQWEHTQQLVTKWMIV